VTVGGVDVGELSLDEARATLRQKLLPRLGRPLRIRYQSRTFRFSPSAAGLRADVDGMARAALERTRSGNLVSRFFREVDGNEVNARLPVQVTYSRPAIAGLAARIKRTLDRPPRDAEVIPVAWTLRKRPSQDGVAVRARRLRRILSGRLSNPIAPRLVKVPVKIKKPKVTTAQLAAKNPFFIVISRGERRLRLFRHLRLAKIYTIAVGRIGLETPAGLYHIIDKEIDPSWHVPNSAWAGSLAGRVIPPGPDDPLKARWMGIYDGAGIHGTDDIGSLGTAASHGCIRMSIPDVEELYDIVPMHAPVYVA
jgi:lipoprotein-anchoring transpeptidase ErfK/SrfK